MQGLVRWLSRINRYSGWAVGRGGRRLAGVMGAGELSSVWKQAEMRVD